MKLLTKYSLILLPPKGFLRDLSFTSPQNPTFSNSNSIRGMVNDKTLNMYLNLPLNKTRGETGST